MELVSLRGAEKLVVPSGDGKVLDGCRNGIGSFGEVISPWADTKFTFGFPSVLLLLSLSLDLEVAGAGGGGFLGIFD